MYRAISYLFGGSKKYSEQGDYACSREKYIEDIRHDFWNSKRYLPNIDCVEISVFLNFRVQVRQNNKL